jgi:hypothetical protein
VDENFERKIIIFLVDYSRYVLFDYRPIALTSQILRESSRCSLTISVRVQQPHKAQKLTILIQNYYPRADGAKRRARVLIPPRLFTPGETKALAKSKVHQVSRA